MRWLRASLAASIVACVLTFAVPIATAPQAQALVVAPPPIPPVLVGGTAAAGGGAVSAGVACVTSVVCLGAVGVAAAAVGLYATRDSWVPTLQRWFGGGEGGTSVVESGTYTYPFVTLNSARRSLDGRTFLYNLADSRTNGYSNAVYWKEYMGCRFADGTFSWYERINAWALTANTVKEYSATCPVGSEVELAFTSGIDNPGSYSPPRYGPSVHVRYVGDAYGDDDSVYRARAVCVKADGSTETIEVEYQGQAGGQAGFMIPSCVAAGAGTHARSVDVDIRLAGRTDFRDAWNVNPIDDPAYPDCAIASGNVCVLDVWVDGSACQVGDARCLEWSSHAQARLQCRWGPYSMPMSACSMLERAYQPNGAAMTDENIDGDPSTPPAPDPAPSGGSFPTEVPIPPDVPEPSDEVEIPGGTGCWPTGTARWNPLEWVLRPVQCALSWAFIPPEGMGAELQEFRDIWNGSDLKVYVDDVGGAGAEIAQGLESAESGCGGPTWTITLGGRDYAFRPLDACNPPMSTIAPVVKGFGTAFVVWAGLYMVTDPLLRALALPTLPGRPRLYPGDLRGK